MAGRLQPRKAEALSGEARCEGNGGGSFDRGEVYFTAAKLSLVKHHYLGAFRCPFLPCSLIRRHGCESSISWRSERRLSASREHAIPCSPRPPPPRPIPVKPWSRAYATRTSIGTASSAVHASSCPRAAFELPDPGLGVSTIARGLSRACTKDVDRCGTLALRAVHELAKALGPVCRHVGA